MALGARSTVRELLERWRETEHDTAGEGFYATFEVPAAAIRCAVAHHGTSARPWDRGPSWCSNGEYGRYVVSAKNLVRQGQPQNADAYIIPLAGGAPQNVTNDPNYWDSAPDWGVGAA